jgi:hypothetical protein
MTGCASDPFRTQIGVSLVDTPRADQLRRALTAAMQYRSVLGSRHHLFDPEHSMTGLTQRGHGRARHVLIGEKPQELSP